MPNTNSAFRELPRFLLAIIFILLFLGTALWLLRPFLSALIWATLIVVATWPLMLGLQKRLGGKRSLAVMVMTATMLLIVILPLAGAAFTVADHADDIALRAKELSQAGLPAPPAWAAKIPVVGPKLVAKWQAAAALPPDELHNRLAPHARAAGGWLLDKAGGLAGFLLHLILTAIIAALFYASGETALAGLNAFARRVGGARAVQSVELAGQAVRSVALGVIVTAVIQSVLGGISLVVAGVPFAGVLTVIMFMLGVAQIGATPVLLVAVVWLFWSGQTLVGTVFLPFALLIAAMDNVIRPILIKRGADLPLVLIFAGVIGGLLSFGVVGLFIGPVVLAIVYTSLVAWVNDGTPAQQDLPLDG